MVFAQQFLLLVHILRLVQNGAQPGKADALVDAALGRVERKELFRVHRAVGEHLHFLAVHRQVHQAYARGLGGGGRLFAHLFARGGQQLARQRGNDVARSHMAGNALGKRQLLVHFIAAKARKVIPARVKEQAVQMALRALHRGGLARAQLAVRLQQALFLAGGGVFGQGGLNALVVAEEIADARVVAQAQSAQEHRHRNFAVFINAHIEHIVRICLKLKPCAAVGVHGGGKQLFARFVVAFAEIHARAAHQLRDNHALGAVVQERAGIRHQREIAHEDLLLFHLARLFVQQACGDAQRRGIGGIALFAFLDGVFGLGIQAVVDEIQHKVAGIILDGGNIAEDLFQALFQKPVVRVFLHLDEVRHVDDFIDARKAHALGFAKLYGLDFHHNLRPLLIFSACSASS